MAFIGKSATHARRAQLPFRNQPVGRQAAVQRARRQAIHIGDEPPHDGAQPEIEVCVSRLPADRRSIRSGRCLGRGHPDAETASACARLPGLGKAASTAVMWECRKGFRSCTPAMASVNPTMRSPSNAPSTCPPVSAATTNSGSGTISTSADPHTARSISMQVANSERPEQARTAISTAFASADLACFATVVMGIHPKSNSVIPRPGSGRGICFCLLNSQHHRS